jgi:NADPH2:quinone reductase
MTIAVRLHTFGEELHLDEIDLPEPGVDDVVFQPIFAGVNPIDRYVAQGKVAADGPLPRTLGCEAAGYCEGRPVLVTHPGLGSTRDGLWADLALVPRAAVVDLPDGVDLRAAAGVGVAGLTAWNVVKLAEVTAVDRVLVLGATGGVGLSVVSCAAAIGAAVLGQTGSPTKTAAILAQGAERAVVADADELAGALDGWEPTVVIDPLGAQFTAQALALLRTAGRLVIFGTSAGPQATLNLQHLYRNGIRVHGYGGLLLTDEQRRRDLTDALRAVREERLHIVVGRTVPLREADHVFDALADRDVIGKVLIDIAG